MAGAALPLPRPRTRSLPLAPRPLAAPRSEAVFLWIAASLLFVTGALNFYIFQVSVVATSAYELQQLERDRDSWRARNGQLEVEVARARSLRWIEHEAVVRLGMVKGETPVYVWVDRAAALEPPLPVEVASEEEVESLPEEPPEASGRSLGEWLRALFGD